MIERIEITDRAQWLDLRRQDVTASDIAVVCGVSPYKTALRLYLEKIGEVQEIAETGLMRRGRWYEPAVIEAARDQTDWLSITPLRNEIYLRDPELRIGATPDAIGTDEDGEFICQLKVVERMAFETWEDDGQGGRLPPLGYQLQTLTEAMLWGASRAFLAVLINEPFNAEFVTYPITRHAGAEARIKAAVAQFWEDIAAGRVPSVDYTRDAETIRQFYPPRDNVEPVDFQRDNYVTALLDERAILKASVKSEEERLEEINSELIHKLNGASAAICDGWRISHKIVHRKAYTVPERSSPVLYVNPIKSKTKEAANA